jgi:putative ABC transport system ATP-binding protein
MTALLRLEGLGQRYGQGPWLFQNLSLDLAHGDLLAMRGESGVGKSTLLNLIAGLDQPSAGRVFFEGVDLAGMSQAQRLLLRRKSIGFVFQAFHLLPHLSAEQNVMVPCLLAGTSVKQARERAAHLLAQLGIAARAQALPAELSGGEQQRVALARALVHSPRLVLADEPTGNLDPATANRALDLLAQSCEQNNTALIMVTHSQAAAARFKVSLQLRSDGLTGLGAFHSNA